MSRPGSLPAPGRALEPVGNGGPRRMAAARHRLWGLSPGPAGTEFGLSAHYAILSEPAGVPARK